MKTHDEMLASLSSDRRADVKNRAQRIAREYLALGDVRRMMEMTQIELSKVLNKPQNTISKTENNADMLLSTLREYIEGLGGELILMAEFPDCEMPVEVVIGRCTVALDEENQHVKQTAAM